MINHTYDPHHEQELYHKYNEQRYGFRAIYPFQAWAEHFRQPERIHDNMTKKEWLEKKKIYDRILTSHKESLKNLT